MDKDKERKGRQRQFKLEKDAEATRLRKLSNGLHEFSNGLNRFLGVLDELKDEAQKIQSSHVADVKKRRDLSGDKSR